MDVYRFVAGAGAPDGTLNIDVRVIDRAGNGDTLKAGSVLIDSTGPVINQLHLDSDSHAPGNDDLKYRASPGHRGPCHR
ncbi:MAG: hypothetical protein R3C68_10015 [Myxococcota bacterium]